jgi:hypothetical protein
MYRSDVEKQIKFLSEKFDYIAIKLPAFLKENNTAVPNSNLQQIIDFILNLLTKKRNYN